MPTRRKSCLSKNPWRKRKILRKLETPEQRAIRLEKDRKRTAIRRAHETEQEREERLARNREAARSRRANTKSSERSAQRKIAMLEENSRQGTCIEKAAQQTNAILQEVYSINCKHLRARGVRRQKTSEDTNERKRCKENTSVFSAGGCTAQNYSPQLMYDERTMAYEAFLSHTLRQSQRQLKFISTYPETPEQMLRLGLVACPADIFCTNPVERTLADNDENENDCSVGLECEVTIEEGEEFEEKKVFHEPFDDEDMHETVECAPTVMVHKPSDENGSLAGLNTPRNCSTI